MKAPEFRRVAVVAKRVSRDATHTGLELAEWLSRRGLEARLDEGLSRAAKGASGAPWQPGEPVDLAIVLGGDGTLLSLARSLPEPVPILGVNLGRLGFLTELSRDELYPSLVKVLAGRYQLETRSMLDVELRRNGAESARYRVLNDAVIAKSAMARIVQLALRVDGFLVGHYRSDGLIVSTPTGSTAYNLSAGGPILSPRLPVAVVTPICPHTLSLRPLVVPDDAEIEVTLETPREEVFLTLDGQEGAGLGYRDTVRLTRSGAQVLLVRTTGRTYYEGLRGKLGWGG